MQFLLGYLKWFALVTMVICLNCTFVQNVWHDNIIWFKRPNYIIMTKYLSYPKPILYVVLKIMFVAVCRRYVAAMNAVVREATVWV